MKLKKLFTAVLILFTIFCLMSCAPSGVTEHEYSFFGGLWHGLIVTFSLIGQIFGADIGLIAEYNTGAPYYIGWVLGILIIGVLSFGRL